MPAFKDPSAADRLTAAASARKAMLEKFLAKPGPDDPAYQARVAEQKAVAEAREQRRLERKAIKDAEIARLAAEAAERKRLEDLAAAEEAAYQARKADAAAAAQAEHKARALALAAEQKAARDARYAARKQRTKR